MGFYLKVDETQPPTTCEGLKEFNTQFFILFVKLSKKGEAWNDIINKCYTSFSNDFKAQLALLNKKAKNEEDLEKILRPFDLSKNKINDLKRRFSVKKDVAVKRDIVPLLKEVSKAKIKDTKEKDLFFFSQSILERLNQKNSSFLRPFIRGHLAALIGNNAWAKKEMKNIMYMGGGVLFDTQRSFFEANEDYETILTYLKDSIKELREKIDDPIFMKIFVRSLAMSTTTEEFDQIRNGFETTWSLARIRKIIETSFGKKYPSFWYPILYERASRAELEKFLKESLTIKEIKQMDFQSFWIFQHYYPADETLREVIVSRVTEKLENSTLEEEFLVLQLLKNEKIKRPLSLVNKKFKRPHFQLEREFFRKTLARGEIVEMSLYSLFRLGDKDSDLLWWPVL